MFVLLRLGVAGRYSLTPLMCGISSAAGTYVVPGEHRVHDRFSAGLCRDPWHRTANLSSSAISEHSDCCNTTTIFERLNRIILYFICVSYLLSISAVSDYGLDNREIKVRSPTEAKGISSSVCFQTGSGAHSACYPMGTGGSSSRRSSAAGVWR
jgi:hypothetical protein